MQDLRAGKRFGSIGPRGLMARFLAAAIAVLWCGLAGCARAVAHPHVWVTVETTVLFDNGSITGLRHKWTFDEFYTAMAVQGLDTNNDGSYSREELAELAKVNIEGLAEFGYFTHAKLGVAPLTFTAPKDYWLDYAVKPADPEATKLPPAGILPRASEAAKPPPQPGFFRRLWALIFGPSKPAADPASADAPAHVLSLNFTLPFRQPVLAEAPDFNFLIADPSFFIALDLARTDPVRLGPGAPATCRIEMAPPESDDAPKPGGFANQTESPSFGFSTSQPIKLSCGPRS